ncbi:MAG: hypothetical protein Kow0069_20720 [Promethearchaeota archaeon]
MRKELDSLRKDKISIAILFLVPIACIVTVGVAKMPRFTGSATTVWIIDYDDSVKSHQLIEAFRNSSSGILVKTNHDDNVTEEMARAEIPKTTLDAYVVVKEGFEEDLKQNRTTSLVVYVDAVDFLEKASTEAAILLTLAQFQIGEVVFERDVFYFPVLEPEESLNLLQLAAPLLVGMLVFASLNLATSQCIVGDVPLKRLLTTPAFRIEVLVAKVLAYTGVAALQVLTSLLLLRYAFTVQIRSTLLELFLHLMLVALSGILLGVLFSAVASTRLQASQLFLFAFIMMLLVSTQVRVEWVLRWLPLEQSKTGFANLAFRGLTLAENWQVEANLLATCGVVFAVTVVYFSKIKKEFV